MKKYLWVWGLLASCLLLLGGCAADVAVVIPDGEQPSVEAPEIKYGSVITEKTQKDQGVVYSTVTISGLELALTDAKKNEALTRINQDLANLSQGFIEKLQMDDQIAHDGMTATQYVHTRDFTVLAQGGDFISIGVGCYDSSSDAAHPVVSKLAYTYDLNSGVLKTLEDYLGTDGQTQAAAQLLQQIKADQLTAEFNPSLAEDLVTNLTAGKWYDNGEGLTIIYNPYEIAAYAAGILEFTISYSNK